MSGMKERFKAETTEELWLDLKHISGNYQGTVAGDLLEAAADRIVTLWNRVKEAEGWEDEECTE